MRTSEAIKVIRKMDRTDLTKEELRALNLAVRALKCQRPTGSWETRHITDSNGISKYRLICNICGRDLFLLYSQDIPDFCSYCGADMRGGQNEWDQTMERMHRKA